MNKKCNICNASTPKNSHTERMEVYRWVKKYGSVQKERKIIEFAICKDCYPKIHPFHKLYRIAAYMSTLAPMMILFSLIIKGGFKFFWGGLISFLMFGAITYGTIFCLFALAITIMDDIYIASMCAKPFSDMSLVHKLVEYGYSDYNKNKIEDKPDINLDTNHILPFETIKKELEENFSCTIK